MPTLKTPQELNNKLWSNLELAIAADNSIDDKLATHFPRPGNWTKSLTQDFIWTNFNSNTELLGNISTISTEHSKILEFLAAHPQLAIATIASGWQGKINILHHFKSFMIDGNEHPTYFAISGISLAASIVQNIPSCLFNKSELQLLDIKNIIKNQVQPASTNTNSTEKASLSNSIILPPKFTEAPIDAKATNVRMA